MRLHGLIYWVALFLICGGGGLTAFAVLSITEYVGKIRRRRRRRQRLRFEQYQAEQAIRSIRREAIRAMLAAERGYDPASGEVIEGTAVEVKR